MPEYTPSGVRELIRDVRPDRVVHGAGFRDLPSNESEAAQCYFTNSELVSLLLSSIAEFTPRAKFLFISSAEIFGRTQKTILDENTPADPQNHYAISKLQGMEEVKRFRTTRGVFAVTAICFNHDSFLSPLSHLVRLVPKKLLALRSGKVDRVTFYNTNMRRDWSHARDFVAAFDLMLEQGTPTDFIVASGKSTTLREYVDLSCSLLGITSKDRLFFDERDDPGTYDRIGCPDKIKGQLGWQTHVSLRQLCREMIHCERP
jgi:GDPmannose 4,6-dehydratase